MWQPSRAFLLASGVRCGLPPMTILGPVRRRRRIASRSLVESLDDYSLAHRLLLINDRIRAKKRPAGENRPAFCLNLAYAGRRGRSTPSRAEEARPRITDHVAEPVD